jgi:hypothetical protein
MLPTKKKESNDNDKTKEKKAEMNEERTEKNHTK